MCSASGLFAVIDSTAAPSCTVAVRSTSSPSIFPASAAFARPAPMEAATSATVAPASSVFFDPSGKTISMIRSFLGAGRCKTPAQHVYCSYRIVHHGNGLHPTVTGLFWNELPRARIEAPRSSGRKRLGRFAMRLTLSARGFKWRRRCMASVLCKRALSYPEWDKGTVPLSH